jgi:hypothetical protein
MLGSWPRPAASQLLKNFGASRSLVSASRSLARNLVIAGTRRCMPALSPKNRLVPDSRGFAMRFTGNFFSEWADVRGGSSHHTLLVTLVACAVGATASGAVILSLLSSPTTQPGIPSIAPRAIVRNADASDATKAAQDQPVVEKPPRPAVTSMVPDRNALLTQAETEHQAEVHSQRSRKHSQQPAREPYWRGRFAHAFSPRFGSW